MFFETCAAGGVTRPFGQPVSYGSWRARLYSIRVEPLGTTGFDVVGSWGWLRVEVPEASLNTGNKISANHTADSHNFDLGLAV
jgi:hypothetical protein